MLANDQMNDLFTATAEAIVNAMVGAQTMTGFQGHQVIALPCPMMPCATPEKV